MKVLWLSHLIPYPPKGGVLQRTFNMISEVGKYHEITLVAFNQSGILKASLPDQDDPLEFAIKKLSEKVKSIHILEIEENSVPGGRYITALKALLSGGAYNMEWLRSAKARSKIKSLLSQDSFDVVHIDTISLCVYADLFHGLPMVLNHHNFESAMLKARSETESNPLKSLYFRNEAAQLKKSESYYCRLADINITCSEDDGKAMQIAFGHGQFLTVPNGVDISYFFPKPSMEVIEESIVIVGGLSWYPNREAVEYFIRQIWPILKKRIPKMRVDVIGRGPTDEMLKLAETDEFFHVHGFVDDVRDYLWQAQFYLCPIKTGGGTKLKILDALASGCCIIADTFACKGIEVKNGENVRYAETAEDYVAAILELQAHPEDEMRLREAGPKLIRNKYSYIGIGQQYSKILIDLVAQKTQKRSTQ